MVDAIDEDERQLDSDRRLSEFWLQEALELSLFNRFCNEKEVGGERALILHAKRHGSVADFLLLDAQRKLIVIEVKRGQLGMDAATKAVAQAIRYAKEEKGYRNRTLGELAMWYCKHLVDVNCWFEYRGDYCLVSSKDLRQEVRAAKKAGADSQYGRLIRWSPRNIHRYRQGTEDSETALKVLREDYARIVSGSLDGLEGGVRLEVGRCIVLAEGWPTVCEPDPVEGITIDLWTYPAPAQWVGPRKQRVEPTS